MKPVGNPITPQRNFHAVEKWKSSCSSSCSPFGKPGKSELLFQHRGGEGRGEKKAGNEGKEEMERLWGLGPGAVHPAGSQHSMSTAQTEKQRGSSHVPLANQWGQPRCAEGWIPYPEDKAREAEKPPLKEPPRGRADEAEGKDEEQGDKRPPPHTSAPLC